MLSVPRVYDFDDGVADEIGVVGGMITGRGNREGRPQWHFVHRKCHVTCDRIWDAAMGSRLLTT
jgi:hypothetical protein